MHQRNLAKTDDHLRKQRLVQGASGNREARGRGRVGMANDIHVGPHAVKKEVHGELGGDLAIPRDLPALKVGHHQVLGRKHPLVHARGGREDAAVAEAHRQVALAGNNETAFVHPAPGNAYLPGMLGIVFCVAW